MQISKREKVPTQKILDAPSPKKRGRKPATQSSALSPPSPPSASTVPPPPVPTSKPAKKAPTKAAAKAKKAAKVTTQTAIVREINKQALAAGMTPAQYFQFIKAKYKASKVIMVNKRNLYTTSMCVIMTGAPIPSLFNIFYF